MFTERVLITAGLSISIIGIVLLFLILKTAELPLEELTAVSEENQDEMVRVEGVVENIRHLKNNTITILTLSEKIERKAIIFDYVNVSEGMMVDVEGNVELYQGEPELVIERLVTR